ncbi:hypothetical protein [Persephonella sp.]
MERVEAVSTPQSVKAEEDYYLITDGKNSLFIKSDLLVMLVFSHGSTVAEDIFREIFNTEEFSTEVKEEVQITPQFTSFRVEKDGQIFENGILIYSPEKEEKKEENSERPVHSFAEKGISLPVVVRVFSRQIPLSQIDSIGESSEILISQSDNIDAELLVNGEVIGKAVLTKDKENFRLKIVELLI